MQEGGESVGAKICSFDEKLDDFLLKCAGFAHSACFFGGLWRKNSHLLVKVYLPTAAELEPSSKNFVI